MTADERNAKIYRKMAQSILQDAGYDERNAKIYRKMAQSILLDAGYKISDLLQGYPQAAHVFVLVVMQGAVNSVLPMLDDLDRQLFETLTAHTTVVVAPSEMDPRRKDAANG